MTHQCTIHLTADPAPYRAKCVCGWISPPVLHTDDAGLLASVHCNKENKHGV